MEIENHICDLLDEWCFDTALNQYNVIRIDKGYQTISEFTSIRSEVNKRVTRLNLAYKKLNDNNIGQYRYEGYTVVYENDNYKILVRNLDRPVNKTEKTSMFTDITQLLTNDMQ